MSQYLEHQQSVLGAIFLEPSCLDEVTQIVHASDFDERHGAIYQACLDVTEDMGIPDFVTISKQCGESSYLSELIDFVPTAANAGFYAKQIAEFGQRRKVAQVISQAKEKLQDGDNPIDWLEVQLSELRRGGGKFKTMREVLKETWKEIEDIAQSGVPMGYKTGIIELDEMAIFQDGDFIVIAGRPGMGKSVLGAQVAVNDKPTLLFNYEMGEKQVCKRLIASESRVNLKNIRLANFNSDDHPKLAKASEVIDKNEVIFCDAAEMSIQDVRASARIAVKKYGVKKIVIDYIQLCFDPTKKANREQEIASIARNCKQMAKELDVCVIGLAQLNRSLENRGNKRPVMSDLRESGAIEQDADAVLFVYRESIYDRKAPEREAEIIIGKYRNGETGWIGCLFFGEYQHFKPSV